MGVWVREGVVTGSSARGRLAEEDKSEVTGLDDEVLVADWLGRGLGEADGVNDVLVDEDWAGAEYVARTRASPEPAGEGVNIAV